jgi:heptosyltransferase-2
MLARLSGARHRIGFARTPGSFLYTDRVPRQRTGHMTERYLTLAGGGSPPATPWLALTEPDRHRVASWLTAHEVGGAFVVLAPGARWGTKRWPYFADLARQLAPEMVVIGGTEDLAVGDSIVAQAAGRARSAVGQLTLRESAAMIERAACVICNDSLALHLASALGRPVVAIFGPTAPAFGFGPWQADAAVVELSSIGCRPCSSHGPAQCPLGHHRCMRDLAPPAVVAAVQQQLALNSPATSISGWR